MTKQDLIAKMAADANISKKAAEDALGAFIAGIKESLGKGEEMIEYVEDRKGHDKRYAINFSKIKNEF